MQPTRTLLRGLSVIEALADNDHDMRLTELAGRVDLDKGTVPRLLFTLLEAGYVRRGTDRGTYRLTAKILHLADGVTAQLDLRYLARPHIASLVGDTRETVHLGVLESDRVIYIEKLEPPSQDVRLVTAVGQTMPIHSTALGTSILAAQPKPMSQEILTRLTLTRCTARTITEKAALRRELETITERGYAIDDEENMENATCVGAAIRDANGAVVGAVSLFAPTFRIADRVDELGEAVKCCADAISTDLGAR